MFRTILISIFITSVAFADTWTVDDDGKADFDNIQAAVDAASDGDEIIVMPGTYTSTAEEVVRIVDKSISLQSKDGPEQTIIDGEGKRTGIFCEGLFTDNTVIDGFTIQNGVDGSLNGGGGIHIRNSDLLIKNCMLRLNYGSYGGAMKCIGGSPSIDQCTFKGNNAYRGAGAYSQNSNSIFSLCIFTSNHSTGEGGSLYLHGSQPTISSCTFDANWSESSGGAMLVKSNSDISNCNFTHNIAGSAGGAMYVNGQLGSVSPIITECSFTHNQSANTGGGIRVVNSPKTSIGASYFCGNYHNNGNGFGNIWGSYVDLSGNDLLDECPECECNLNGDDVVDIDDLLQLVATWGECENCSADFDANGNVNVDDLIYLISNWGPCE